MYIFKRKYPYIQHRYVIYGNKIGIVVYGNGVRSVLLSFVPQIMTRGVLHPKWKAGCGGGESEHLLLNLVSCAYLGRQKVFPGCFSLEVTVLCFASLLR